MNRTVLFVVASLAALAVGAGCTNDTDPEWQLDHDRIVAVRATPPRILAGETSTLDLLIARKGDTLVETPPVGAMVVSPESLASAVTFTGGTWVVTAPGEAELAAARGELMLAADAPVPLVVGVAVTAAQYPSGMGPFAAIKTVYLGASGANPTIGEALVDGVAAPASTEIVVGAEVDVPLSVPFDDTATVRWLTSCGTMHDFDLPQAYLRVEPEDPTEGELAVVVRLDDGGVAWRTWPIRAQP